MAITEMERLEAAGQPNGNGAAKARFAPEVKAIRTRARRVVNLGRYRSFELSTELEAAPDPHHRVAENIDRLQQMVIRRVDEVCDAMEASLNHTNHEED